MTDNNGRNIWDALGDVQNEGNQHQNTVEASPVPQEDVSIISTPPIQKKQGDINGNEENRTLMIPSLTSFRDKLGFGNKENDRKQGVMKLAAVRSPKPDATAAPKQKTPRSPENIFDKAFGFMKAVKPVMQGGGVGSQAATLTPDPPQNRVASPAINMDQDAPPPLSDPTIPLDLSKASRTIKVPEQFKKSATPTRNEDTEQSSTDSPLDLSFKKRPGDPPEGPPLKKLGVEVQESVGANAGKGKADGLAKPLPHRTSIFPKPAHTNSDSLRRQSGIPGASTTPPVVTGLPFRTAPRWNAVLPGNPSSNETGVRAVKVSPVRPHIKGKPVYEALPRNKDGATLPASQKHETSAGGATKTIVGGIMNSLGDGTKHGVGIAIPLQAITTQGTGLVGQAFAAPLLVASSGNIKLPVATSVAVPSVSQASASQGGAVPSSHHKVVIKDGKVMRYSPASVLSKVSATTTPAVAKKAMTKGLLGSTSPLPPTLLNVPIFKPLERKPKKSAKLSVSAVKPLPTVKKTLNVTTAMTTMTITTTNIVTTAAATVPAVPTTDCVTVKPHPVVMPSRPNRMSSWTLAELTQKLANQLDTEIPEESSDAAESVCVDSPSVSQNVSESPTVSRSALESSSVSRSGTPQPSTAPQLSTALIVSPVPISKPVVSHFVTVSKSMTAQSISASNPVEVPISASSLRPQVVIGQGPIMAARKSTAKPTRLPWMCARKSTALMQKSAKRAAKLQRLAKRESPPRLMVISPERSSVPTPPQLPSPPMPLLSPTPGLHATQASSDLPLATSTPRDYDSHCDVVARQDPVFSTDSAGSTPSHDGDSEVVFKRDKGGLFSNVLKLKCHTVITHPTQKSTTDKEQFISVNNLSSLPSFQDKKRTISKFKLSLLNTKSLKKDDGMDELRNRFKSPAKMKDLTIPKSPRSRPRVLFRSKPQMFVPDLSEYPDMSASQLAAFMPTRSADLSPISWSVISTTSSMHEAMVTLTLSKPSMSSTDISSTRYYQTTILKQFVPDGRPPGSQSPLSPLSITIPPEQPAVPTNNVLTIPSKKPAKKKCKSGLPIVAKDWKESTYKYKRNVLLMPKKLVYIPKKAPKGFRGEVTPIPAQLKKKTSSVNKLITKVGKEAIRKAKREAKKSTLLVEDEVYKKKRKKKKKLNLDVKSATEAAQETENAKKAYSILPSPDGSSTKITIIHSPVSAAIHSPMATMAEYRQKEKAKKHDDINPSTCQEIKFMQDASQPKVKKVKKDFSKKHKSAMSTIHVAELSQSDDHVVPKITIKTSPRATSPRGGDYDYGTQTSPRHGMQTSPRHLSPRGARTPSITTTTEACTTLIHDISPESSSPCPKVKITFKTVPKVSDGYDTPKNPPTPKVTIRTGHTVRKEPDLFNKDTEPQKEHTSQTTAITVVTQETEQLKPLTITRRDLEHGVMTQTETESADTKTDTAEYCSAVKVSEEVESSEEEMSQPAPVAMKTRTIEPLESSDDELPIPCVKIEKPLIKIKPEKLKSVNKNPKTSKGQESSEKAKKSNKKSGKKIQKNSENLQTAEQAFPKAKEQERRTRSPVKRLPSTSSDSSHSPSKKSEPAYSQCKKSQSPSSDSVSPPSKSPEKSVASFDTDYQSKPHSPDKMSQRSASNSPVKPSRKTSQSPSKIPASRSPSADSKISSKNKKSMLTKTSRSQKATSQSPSKKFKSEAKKDHLLNKKARSQSPCTKSRSQSPSKKSKSKSPLKKCRSQSPSKEPKSSKKIAKLSRTGSKDSKCSASSVAASKKRKAEKKRRAAARKEQERKELEERRRRKRRSLLDELANSEGYIADKRERKSDTLWADPNKLSREERALQRAMLQFTKMELGIEVGKGRPGGPSSQLSPVSSLCSSTSSSAHTTPETADVKQERHETSAEITATPNRYQAKPRSLAASKAKFLRDNALKRSRGGDNKNKRKGNQSPSPKKSTFQDFKPTILESRTRRQAQATRFSESSDGVGVSSPPPGSCSASVSSEPTRHRRSTSVSYRDFDDFGEYLDEGGITIPTTSTKKKSKSVRMRLVQRATNVARDVIKKKYQEIRGEKKHSRVARRDNPWADDYEETVYDLPNTDTTFEVMDTMSQAGSHASSQDHVPPEVKKISVVRETGENVLHKAARLGYKEATLWCCENKYVNLNSKDHAGYAPLHEASTTGNVTIAKYLIAYGADVNVSSLDGVRPLHDAVENNHFEMVRLLLSCGADIQLATYTGQKVLDLARTPEMKSLLKGYLADMNGSSDEDSITPWELPQIPPPDGDEDELEELDPVEACGCDVLDDIPSDDDMDCVDVEFQFSSKPHLSSYYIRASRDDIPRNYVLLRDVVERLDITRQDLASAHPGLYVINLSINAFLRAVNSSQLCYRSKQLTLEPRHNSIELVELDATLHDILDVDIITVRDRRSYRKKRKKSRDIKPEGEVYDLTDHDTSLDIDTGILDTSAELDLSGETVEGVMVDDRPADKEVAAALLASSTGRSYASEMAFTTENITEGYNVNDMESVQGMLMDNQDSKRDNVVLINAESKVEESSKVEEQNDSDMTITDQQENLESEDYMMHDENATDEGNLYIDEDTQKEGDDIDVEVVSDGETPDDGSINKRTYDITKEPVEIVEIPDSPPRQVIHIEPKCVDDNKHKRSESCEKKDKHEKRNEKRDSKHDSRHDARERDRNNDKKRHEEARRQQDIARRQQDEVRHQQEEARRRDELRYEEETRAEIRHIERMPDMIDDRPAFTFPSLHCVPNTPMYTAADIRMLHSAAVSYATAGLASAGPLHTMTSLHPPSLYSGMPSLHQPMHSPLSSLHYPHSSSDLPLPPVPLPGPTSMFLNRPYLSDPRPTYLPQEVPSYLLTPPAYPTPTMLHPAAPNVPGSQDKPVQLQILDITSLGQHGPHGLHHLQ